MKVSTTASAAVSNCRVSYQAEQLHRVHDVRARVPRLLEELMYSKLPPCLADTACSKQILRASDNRIDTTVEFFAADFQSVVSCREQIVGMLPAG